MPLQPGVKFIYLFCNDVAAMRHFYTDLVGLKETHFADGPEGGVTYDCDGLQFTIFGEKSKLPVTDAWAWQPGWGAGDSPTISWSVVLTEDAYGLAVQRLIDANVPRFDAKPQWRGYWSFPTQDPMGNTVEIVLPLDEEPARTAWEEQEQDHWD